MNQTIEGIRAEQAKAVSDETSIGFDQGRPDQGFAGNG